MCNHGELRRTTTVRYPHKSQQISISNRRPLGCDDSGEAAIHESILGLESTR